jgi:hypothetical protein
VKEEVISYHSALLEKALARLPLEGYERIYILDETNMNDVVMERIKAPVEPRET